MLRMVFFRYAPLACISESSLGPLLVQFVSLVFRQSYAVSYNNCSIFLLFCINVVCWSLFYKLTRNINWAFSYFFVFSSLYIAFQDVKWLYIWDYIDIIVYFLFAYGMFTKKK